MLDIPGYTLLGAIRATGSNVLFHAVRHSDGVPVIVKTPMGPSLGPRERERYRREHDILRRLQGVRGVTRLHAYELIHERPVLLLEEVEGQPLSESVGKPFEVARFLELAIHLSSVLAEIHLRGVIHKDIKPSNIMLTPSGEPRIIDFGAATLQQVEHVDAASLPLVEGTLAYMSPEQTGRMNRSVDYRTDLYSLGVTFYELLTATRPFHGRDALEWFHAHMAQVPRAPHELAPHVPPVLSAIVMKLLAKVAEERYQGAEGLKADLERCQEGLRRGALKAFPLGVHDIPSRFQRPQRLYGRDTHVASLLQGFERVIRGGRPELILISGYSGIGKSSVVNELHRPVVQRRGFFLSGKFDQFQRDVPYATLAQAIRGLVQQLLAGTDAELARWRERLREAWGDNGQVMVDVVPQLELVVGQQPAVQQVPPGEAQSRFHRVFQQCLGVFATAEHPLVIFLDDLQWADLASLQLLQHLLTRPDTPPLLLIGAYRDNEVSPSHPLVLVLGEVRKAGARVTDIRLEPLSLEQVQRLVADALPGAGPAVVQPLAELVREKTGGNPFFLLQLMLALNQDGLLTRTPERGWRWDAEGVRAKAYSDNVVDFLVGKLRQLSLGVQHLLRLAACVGNSFSLSMLVIISGMERDETEQGLEQALQEGLLVRGGLEQYRFLHDRIQQAAYVLIPEEERRVVHLRIGRLLLESLSPEELREKLFDIVGQLNAGADLIDSPEERHRLARLNAEAGWRAKASIAPRSAVVYFTKAFSLIPGDPWEVDHELAFKLRLDQANSELMIGNAAEARRLTEELRSRARTRADTAAAYCLKNDLHIAAGEIQESLTCLLECLTLLGMPIPAHPSWEEVIAAQEEVWTLLGGRPIESLIHLPLMTDPDIKVVMDVLAALFAPAYYTDNNLLILHLCRMVCLSLRYGNSDAAAHGYSWFGVMCGFVFKRHCEAHAFGVLAREFTERHKLPIYRGRVLFNLSLINHWSRHLSTSQEFILRAFQQALLAGDYQVACYCCSNIVSHRLLLGHNLEEVHQEAVARIDFVRKCGFLDLESIIHFHQRYAQQLRGLTRSFDTLSGEDFEEKTFEAGLTPDRMSTMRCWYWVIKMQSRFMCGAYGEALAAGDKASEVLWSLIGSVQLMDFHFYRALILAACHEGATAQEQQRFRESMQQHQQQLEEWASHCPETFRAPERMVSGELARITGRLDEAMRAYDEALQAARKHGFIQHVALANELAANFWRARQVPSIAEAYAREARGAYLQWGALGKVRHLDTQWPHLTSSMATSGVPTTNTNSTQLDALTLVKAQQAISGEIVLGRLVTTLVQVAIENAGAQRGALLLPQGDTLSVAVLSGASPDSAAAPTEEAARELPWTLIAYVKRTQEHVLIDDASKPHPFSSDGYFEQGRARSMLCLPLVHKGAFYGVLYLENSLATDAFTPARLSLLEHIASQAAISIENARLYAEVQRAEGALRRANDELEQRVEERTRELKQAQAQLVDTARSAGMAEIASNVLHNVGNVLTSAVVNLDQMRDAVEGSRIGRLRQLSTLLGEHRGDLVDFLTHDPRGSRMPDYISALTEELLREQAALRECLAAMGLHIEHIRAIVQVQQTYAKAALLIDECDLSWLIEDALRIQMPALQRHGIRVTRELAPTTRVKVDKHKVLQILINLISNAKNAMEGVPEGQRHLGVKLTAEGKMARIEVVDNGVGIAPEIHAKLFSHGFTTRKEGHGFGLHSSALAAQMLGGRLTLESDGPGQGATATLELPLL